MPAKKVATPKRGTIASRYLQAISNQAAAVEKYDKHGNNSSDGNGSNNTSFLSSLDCSMTASTTLLDQSESWTTNGTKSRSSGAVGTQSAPTTPTRKKRSGTNSGISNQNYNNSSYSYHSGGNHTPGSRSTMPLSGGEGTRSATSSRPTTPTKHLPPPGTATTVQSIMGIDNDDSSLESASTHGRNQQLAIELGDLEQEEHLRQQEEQLQELEKVIGMGCSPVNSRPTTPTNRSQHSLGSLSCHTPGGNSTASGMRHGMFPRTTPRTPTKSPGRQQDLTNPRAMTRTTDTKSPRSSGHSRPTTPTNRPRSPSIGWKKSQDELNDVLGSEAGAPTEVMTNRTRDVMLQHRLPSSRRPPSEAESTQPTEVMTNRTSDVLTRVRKKWDGRNQESGREHEGQGAAKRGGQGGETEVHSPMYTIPHQNNGGSGRGRISSYWGSKKHGGDSNIPSLMDSQSSSMSLPDERRPERAAHGDTRHSHSAHGRLLDSLGTPALQHAVNSRLSTHVQKARRQSILSPSMSETTATASLPSAAAAVGNESIYEQNLLGRDDSIAEEHDLGAETSGRKDAGRNVGRRPSGNGRIASLAEQLRRTKWTIRGAQQQQQQHIEQHKKQSAMEEKIRKKGAEPPDPIISVTGSGHDGDDYNRYHDDDDDESTLPEYTERHERGAAERADEFVVYNERAVKNAAAVFQTRWSSDSLGADDAEGGSQGGQRRRSLSQHSRASTERGKSPIQPLFSLDRVDLESNDPPRQGRRRSMTPEQFLRSGNFDFEEGEHPRRSNSLSRSLERNIAKMAAGKQSINSPDDQVPEVLVFDKMRHDEDEDNSVLEEELVKIMERTSERQGMTQTSTLPHSSIHTATPTIRIKTPPSSGRKTPSGSGHSSVLTTKSVKDKIREFNLRTPEKWRKSPGVTTPIASERNQQRNRRYHPNEPAEEKKEDGACPYEEDDSSVKSLRDKLEKRFAHRHNSLGLDRTNKADDGDDYSVQSLRERLEQRIHESNDDCGDENDDEGSVRSLRERFENPVNKPKGKNVSNLRAMFESKPKATAGKKYHVVKTRAKPNLNRQEENEATASQQEHEQPRSGDNDAFNAKLQELQGSRRRREEPYGRQDTFDVRRQALTRELSTKPGAEQQADEYKWVDFEKSPHRSHVNHPDSRFAFNAKENSVETYIKQSFDARSTEISSTIDKQHANQRSIDSSVGHASSSSRKDLSSPDQPNGTKVSCGIKERANGKQISNTHPLTSHDPRRHEVELNIDDIERTGLYDMTCGRDGAGSPDTDALIAAVAVPGSHWAISGNNNAQGKTLQRGDIKGTSSDSEYSDAVTLDASIADVSLLTNPSAIRTMGSDMERRSDTSSSVFELLAHKSEASSSQPSEALAPLIPDPLHHKSDDSTQILEQSTSPTRQQDQSDEKMMAASRQKGWDSGYDNNPVVHSHAISDEQESASEWKEYHFDSSSPFRKEPPDDPFKLDPVGSDAFSDPAWPDFGDVNDFARTRTSGEPELKGIHTSLSPDPPANTEGSLQAFPTKADPPSTIEKKSTSITDTVRPSQQPSSRPHHFPSTGHATSAQTPNHTPPLQRRSDDARAWDFGSSNLPRRSQPSHIPSSQRTSKTLERSTATKHVSAASPLFDYSPSQDERSRQPSQINAPSASSVIPESAINVPEVPSLPSPFDPNYASIMAARHKMLLSRQRALLSRRAAREQTQYNTPTTEAGFFGRTHPDRSARIAQVYPSIQLSQRTIAISDATEPSPCPSAVVDEPWEAFGPNDPTKKAFEALVRPSRHSPMRGVQRDHPHSSVATPLGVQRGHPHIYSSTTPAAMAKQRTQPQSPASRGNDNSSLFSKVTSALGLESDYRTGSQSEAVIARITAVRAARMKRYHEKNAPKVSYRQRTIDRETMREATGFQDADDHPLCSGNGYRFYTHDDDMVMGGPKTFEANFTSDGGDSLSTSSNAVEYAATLAVD